MEAVRNLVYLSSEKNLGHISETQIYVMPAAI